MGDRPSGLRDFLHRLEPDQLTATTDQFSGSTIERPGDANRVLGRETPPAATVESDGDREFRDRDSRRLGHPRSSTEMRVGRTTYVHEVRPAGAARARFHEEAALDNMEGPACHIA